MRDLLHVGRRQLVLAISARTFFPVVIDAAPIGSLATRLRDSAGGALHRLGIPRAIVDAELDEMLDVVWARSANRQATGILVDFAKALPFYLEDGSSLEVVAAKLAYTPCSPLYRTTVSPDHATIALFDADRESGPPLTSSLGGGAVIT